LYYELTSKKWQAFRGVLFMKEFPLKDEVLTLTKTITRTAKEELVSSRRHHHESSIYQS
jgi:hypothetical protein